VSVRRHVDRVAATCLATVALSAAPRAGAAQEVGACPVRPGERAFAGASAVFTASPATEEVTAVHAALQASAAVRVGRRFCVTLDATAALTSFVVYGEPWRNAPRVGNPLVAAHVALWERPAGLVHLGLGVGAPLVTVPGTIPTNVDAAQGDLVSAAARGFSGYWLWARNSVPVVLFARAMLESRAGIVLGAELQPGFLASVSSAGSRFALVGSASIGYRLGRFVPGLRGQVLATSAPLAPQDFSQFSAGVFVRYERGRTLLRLDAVANLDGPYGPAGVTNTTVWGVSFGVGHRW
jgi:hypothetical protein